MQEHSRYEELCAAAAAGQISATELTELRAHMELCNFCKDLQREFVEIGSFCLTQAQRLEPEIYSPESALRSDILRRLQKGGATFSPRLQKEIGGPPRKLPTFPRAPLRVSHPIWAIALIAVGAALGLSFPWARNRASDPRNLIDAAEVRAPLPVVSDKLQSVSSNQDSELIRVEHEKADLEKNLRASEEERGRLRSEVAELAKRVAVFRDSANQALSQIDQFKTAANQDRAAAAAVEAQLHKLTDDEAA